MVEMQPSGFAALEDLDGYVARAALGEQALAVHNP